MTPIRVDAATWIEHFAGLKAQGFVWFDFLSAIDRGDHVDVIACVADLSHSQSALVTTAVSVELDSLSGLFVGARWYERETQEMFGIGFIGLVDQRPLIRRSFLNPPPLRKTATP
ncbi:MAG: NADH-quinone oxidoreductase subunit C [Actinomycetota bacterium]|nr:NADH-quinone oxidoreductase subunit C [Actinomycetota bacterium]MDP2287796.1 NADH-quinone oxidoreductase subunit C [Actinomycetota bacterium]